MEIKKKLQNLCYHVLHPKPLYIDYIQQLSLHIKNRQEKGGSQNVIFCVKIYIGFAKTQIFCKRLYTGYPKLYCMVLISNNK